MSGWPLPDGEEQLRVQIARLQEQLAEEQLLRRQAEEAVEAVTADRNRLQRARDELATALLMAERRTQEAEEEQLKAEAAAAALAQQLAEAQREAAHVAATTATAAGGSVAADQASVAGTPVAEPSQPAAQRGAAQREQQPQRAELQSEGSEAQLARDAEVLLAELDRERHRSEELVRMLEAAEHEAVLATDRLMKAQQRIKQLEAKGKGKHSGKDSSKDGGKDGGGAEDSLGQAPSAASLEGSAGGDAPTLAVLQQRIAALKASRDKLIGAFDAQAAEVERLSADNAALAESLAQLRDVAAKWEAQALGSLAQNERLKDLLEESATWSIPSAAPTAGAAGATAEAGAAVAAAAALAQQPAGADGGDGGEAAASAAGAGGARDGGVLSALCQRFERELLLEKAKTAQLDMQVRALCMELTRAAQSSGQMQAALAPMLGGIEARLVQVLGMRPRAGVASSAG